MSFGFEVKILGIWVCSCKVMECINSQKLEEGNLQKFLCHTFGLKQVFVNPEKYLQKKKNYQHRESNWKYQEDNE